MRYRCECMDNNLDLLPKLRRKDQWRQSMIVLSVYGKSLSRERSLKKQTKKKKFDLFFFFPKSYLSL